MGINLLRLLSFARIKIYQLRFFASGMSMKEVEVKYQFAENTLRAHRRNMMQKNNCTYEKLLSCFHHFPPEVPFDPNFAAKKGSNPPNLNPELRLLIL